MSKKNKIRCSECGALYDPNEVEHISLEAQPLQPCIIVPIEDNYWDD